LNHHEATDLKRSRVRQALSEYLLEELQIDQSTKERQNPCSYNEATDNSGSLTELSPGSWKKILQKGNCPHE